MNLAKIQLTGNVVANERSEHAPGRAGGNAAAVDGLIGVNEAAASRAWCPARFTA